MNYGIRHLAALAFGLGLSTATGGEAARSQNPDYDILSLKATLVFSIN